MLYACPVRRSKPQAIAATVLVGILADGLVAADAGPQAVSLRGCVVRMATEHSTVVKRAVDDLCHVIASRTGKPPKVLAAGGLPSPAPGTTVIEVRTVGVPNRNAIIDDVSLQSPDGHVIESRWEGDGPSRHAVVSLTGAGESGAKFAVVELTRLLRLGERDVTIEVPLRATRSPRFAMRSMYAHLHWSYNAPYALRSWQIEDWRRYIDLLTHLGFNTIQIWPMMELLPHPLSTEDEAYLRRYAEIVDYAHDQRGMKVFIGSCPNNITEDARGVPIARREYFDFEKLLDPGRPTELHRILDCRSDLYKTIPHADGYWIIDSDPGGWKGSPSSDFVNILIGHRGLIDKYGRRPAVQPVIYWMWFGWGTDSPEQNWRATLSDMKARLKGSWQLHACNPGHIAACRELGLLDRAYYFPYGTLEDEPCGPLTELRFRRIQDAVAIAEEAGLPGVQGNTQTPLVQLPNIAALAFALWGGDAGTHGDEVLNDLSGRLLCKDADVLARAWKSLSLDDAEGSLQLADRLRQLAADKSAAGTLAVVLGDWQPRILEDLATMLTIHARAVAFAGAVEADAKDEALTAAMVAWLEAIGEWLARTGYHNRAPVWHEAYRGHIVRALARLRERRGPDAAAALFNKASVTAHKLRDSGMTDAVRDVLLGKD